MTLDPTTTRPRADPREPLLERADELAALQEAASRALEGQGSVVAVLGPAGIGKTSLLDTACDQAAAYGLGVLSARGGELERDFPYGIVRQLFERPLRDLPARRRAAVLGEAAAPAAAAFALTGAPAPRQRFDVLHGLYWACANLAAERPLLLVIDDAHWADTASLRFLAYLARRVDELPVVLALAARPSVDEDVKILLAAVTEAVNTRTLRPAALSDAAVAGLLGESFGAPVGDELVQACRHATAGNPFLCRALISALAERRSMPDAADVAAVAGRSVSALVVNRLGRLSPAATALAHAVAVLGADADLRHAGTLAGLSDEAGAQAADALAAQGILRIGRPLEFVHPLVRSAVYERMPRAARLLAHARAARLLEGAAADADAIAAQLMATQPAGDRWAAQWLERAADLAMRRGASQAAIAYLRRALEEGPAGASLLHRLGAAEIQAGAPGEAIEHLSGAHDISTDARERTRIGADLIVALATTGRYAEASRVGAELLDHAAAVDDDVVATVRGQMLQVATLEPSLRTAGDALLPDADAPCLSGGTRGAREYLAALTTHATLRLQPADAALLAARRAVAAGIGEDLTAGPIAWTNTVYPVIVADDFDLADEIVRDAFDHLTRVVSIVGTARAYAARSMLHLRRGELRDAVADGDVAVSTGREASFYIWVLAMSSLVDALVEQGETALAAMHLREMGQDGALPDSFLHNWLLHARGRLRLAQGDRRAAIADFEECLRRGEHRELVNPAVAPYRSSLALALGPRDADRAHELATEELALARRWGAPRAVGTALRALGLTSPETDAAITALTDSADTLASSGARLEHARSLIDLGAALRRSGRRSDAREHLHRGMEQAHACGAEPLVARARDELLAAGARPRRIMRTGLDALTASELRVARLAAEGRSNREIAQTLYVTLRTVELHLTHAYQKLGIARRDALGAALGAEAQAG